MFKPLAALKALYLNAHGVDADNAPSLLTDAQRAHNNAVLARIGDAPTGEAYAVRAELKQLEFEARRDGANATAARLLEARMMGVDL